MPTIPTERRSAGKFLHEQQYQGRVDALRTRFVGEVLGQAAPVEPVLSTFEERQGRLRDPRRPMWQPLEYDWQQVGWGGIEHRNPHSHHTYRKPATDCSDYRTRASRNAAGGVRR